MHKVRDFIFSKSGSIILVMGLLLLVSFLSGYNIVSPYEVNFEIANMLTPYGLVKNLVAEKTALTPYYHQAPESTASPNGLLYFCIFILDLYIFSVLRKLR